MTKINIDRVYLDGAATARGRAFGIQKRAEIASWLDDWLASLRQDGVDDPRPYLTGMLAETQFVPAISTHAPDLLEEVRGIAAGAEQPFDLILASQFMDEEWAYRTAKAAKSSKDKCSTVGIRCADGTTWVGQNMDLPQYTDGHQRALMISGDDGARPNALIVTIGGMIGLLGVNAKGVCVCVNALFQLPTAQHGMPVAFVVRKLLQANTLADAVTLVHQLPHATGQHYLIGDSTGIRSFEASPAGVLEYAPKNSGRVLHTNHPLAGRPEQISGRTSSTVRLNALAQRLDRPSTCLADVMGALSSCDDAEFPISRVGAEGAGGADNLTAFTTTSFIAELKAGSIHIPTWISAGPPSTRPYEQVLLPT